MSNLLSRWRDTSPILQLVRQIIIAPPLKKKGHRVLVALWPEKKAIRRGMALFFDAFNKPYILPKRDKSACVVL